MTHEFFGIAGPPGEIHTYWSTFRRMGWAVSNDSAYTKFVGSFRKGDDDSRIFQQFLGKVDKSESKRAVIKQFFRISFNCCKRAIEVYRGRDFPHRMDKFEKEFAEELKAAEKNEKDYSF